MKKIFLISVIMLNMSCSKSTLDENADNSGIVSFIHVEFSILNETGDDLLNPVTPGYFSFEKMKLYFLIKGEKIAVQDYDPQIGGNNGIRLLSERSPYNLRCIIYDHGENGLISEVDGVKTGTTTAFLELKEGVTDTIKTEWISKEGKYTLNTKIWYNGVLQESVERAFEVRK